MYQVVSNSCHCHALSLGDGLPGLNTGVILLDGLHIPVHHWLESCLQKYMRMYLSKYVRLFRKI